VEILLEKQGGVLIDLFRHLSLVRNRRDAETVKLDELRVGLSKLVPPLDLTAGQAGVSLS
jgi:hypothetical protein